MISCLNNTICGNKQRFYYEWCNYYSNNGFYYEEAPLITCHRDNIQQIYPTCERCWTGFIDCCADNKEDCCIRSKTSYPTITPTAVPTPLCPINHYFQKNEKCNFLELQNTDISYNDENSMVCCTNDRSKCCPFNYYILYIMFGIIGTFLLIVIIFIIRDTKNTKINPETKLRNIVSVSVPV